MTSTPLDSAYPFFTDNAIILPDYLNKNVYGFTISYNLVKLDFISASIAFTTWHVLDHNILLVIVKLHMVFGF